MSEGQSTAPTAKCLGGCEEAQRDLGFSAERCCTSCHEDDDLYGMEMCYIETDGGFFEVCCVVLLAWEER